MMRTGAAGRGRLVGQPMRRTEDRRFLTGAACYVGDFERARMCHAVVVRSPLAARAPARGPLGRRAGAARCPRGADRPRPRRRGRADPDPPRPAARLRSLPAAGARSDRVRYVGEPVAAGDRRGPLRRRGRGRRWSRRSTSRSSPWSTCEQAMTDHAVLHEAAGTNVASRYTVSRGDPDAAFATAPLHAPGDLPLPSSRRDAARDARARSGVGRRRRAR